MYNITVQSDGSVPYSNNQPNQTTPTPFGLPLQTTCNAISRTAPLGEIEGYQRNRTLYRRAVFTYAIPFVGAVITAIGLNMYSKLVHSRVEGDDLLILSSLLGFFVAPLVLLISWVMFRKRRAQLNAESWTILYAHLARTTENTSRLVCEGLPNFGRWFYFRTAADTAFIWSQGWLGWVCVGNDRIGIISTNYVRRISLTHHNVSSNTSGVSTTYGTLIGQVSQSGSFGGLSFARTQSQSTTVHNYAYVVHIETSDGQNISVNFGAQEGYARECKAMIAMNPHVQVLS